MDQFQPTPISEPRWGAHEKAEIKSFIHSRPKMLLCLQIGKRSPVSSVGFPPGKLLKGARHENRVVDEITMGEPPRLGH